MSDSEEENFCFYGKALEPYDEDSFPKKKPISLEEQIATDEHGRRRFHGAFTGGFSAGFFNTVGSLEGWKPSEFKSSRSEKAEKKMWKPEDYMDEEDTGEFGIAPQTVKATKEYSTSKKRKKQIFSDGPIPGEPVLHTLISSGNETVGYLLMRNMSFKNHVEPEGPKTYGCEMPKTYEIKRNTEDDVIPIPDIYLQYLKEPKINTFGLSYVGLSKTSASLYKPTQLVVHDKNKKFSIAGQAFGVGAFEEDDEDIYAKDDMGKYDFELTAEAKAKKKEEFAKSDSMFEIFQQSKVKLLQPEKFPLPVIPQSFSGKHNIKKSRFEPIPEPEEPKPRKKMNATIRARYLGEEEAQVPAENTPSSSQAEQKPDIPTKDFVKTEPENDFQIHGLASGLVFGKFVSASRKENLHDILETVERTETEHGTQEMRDAAKLNMFGPLTRVVAEWKPCGLMCKRFNVPEPTFDLPKKDTKRKNPIIFEYQKNKASEPILKPGLVKTKPDEVQEQTENVVEEMSVNEEVQESKPLNNDEPPPEDTVKEEEVPRPVDPTDKIDVSKNIDLFKAVFLSSSESESEDEKEKEEEAQSRNDLIKATVLSDHLIPKIRTKLGILSNIGHTFNPLFKKQDASPEINKDERTNEGEGEKNTEGETSKLEDVVNKPEDANLYGPKLPERIQPVQQDRFVLPKTASSKEKWVEKDAHDKKKHKHKKKNKKEKHRKKEHRK